MTKENVWNGQRQLQHDLSLGVKMRAYLAPDELYYEDMTTMRMRRRLRWVAYLPPRVMVLFRPELLPRATSAPVTLW